MPLDEIWSTLALDVLPSCLSCHHAQHLDFVDMPIVNKPRSDIPGANGFCVHASLLLITMEAVHSSTIYSISALF